MSRRDDALAIFDHALKAVAPERLINRNCRLVGTSLKIQNRSYDLGTFDRVFVFGSGKAAIAMGKAIHTLLEGRIAGGLLVSPNQHEPIGPIDVMPSTHPNVSKRSVEAAVAMRERLLACKEEDLVIYLLSGGSSALLEEPAVTLEALGHCYDLMLQHDIGIGRINAVRKHLSLSKGGQLGQYCASETAVLVISDVLGNDLHTIGSAPLFCDDTTFQEALEVVEPFRERVDPSVLERLTAGASGEIPETPKQEASNITHYLIGTNSTAVEAAKEKAVELGYSTGTFTLVGESREAAALLRKRIAEYPFGCLIGGGETTVIRHGDGKGGRNQQLCLLSLGTLEEDECILCGGTDGVDGNSDAAGAVIDTATRQKAQKLGLSAEEHLLNDDANTFFSLTGDTIVTGPTETNVMDIVVILHGRPE